MEATFKYCSHFNVYKNDVYEQKKNVCGVYQYTRICTHEKGVHTLHKNSP